MSISPICSHCGCNNFSANPSCRNCGKPLTPSIEDAKDRWNLRFDKVRPNQGIETGLTESAPTQHQKSSSKSKPITPVKTSLPLPVAEPESPKEIIKNPFIRS